MKEELQNLWITYSHIQTIRLYNKLRIVVFFTLE